MVIGIEARVRLKLYIANVSTSNLLTRIKLTSNPLAVFKMYNDKNLKPSFNNFNIFCLWSLNNFNKFFEKNPIFLLEKSTYVRKSNDEIKYDIKKSFETMNIDKSESTLTIVLDKMKFEYIERLDWIRLWRLKYSEIVSVIIVNNNIIR